MNQNTTPEQLIQDARDRGKVLRCAPADGPLMDFVTVGRVIPDKWAGMPAGEDSARLYGTEEMKEHVEEAFPCVYRISEENTRWGTRRDGEA